MKTVASLGMLLLTASLFAASSATTATTTTTTTVIVPQTKPVVLKPATVVVPRANKTPEVEHRSEVRKPEVKKVEVRKVETAASSKSGTCQKK